MGLFSALIRPNIGRMEKLKDFDRLGKALRYQKDPAVRREAAIALGNISDPRGAEPLISALKDEERSVRETIAEALGKIGDMRAVEPLIDALKDPNLYFWKAAAEALGKLGDMRAVEPLIVALKDADYRCRKSGAEALLKLADPRAIEPFIAALGDQEYEVRRIAAEALWKFGDLRAVEPLIGAIKDKDIGVSKAAAAAVRKIAGVEAVEPLISALKGGDRFSRKLVAGLLGEIGDLRAVEPLIAILNNRSTYDEFASAVWALEKLGWQPKFESEKDWVFYYYATNRFKKLEEMGLGALDHLISLFQFQSIPIRPATEYLAPRDSPGAEMLRFIMKIGGARGEEEVLRVMKGRGSFCKIARDLLNSGKSSYEDHCLCPKCYAYLGIRGRGGLYRCPGCGDEILV